LLAVHDWRDELPFLAGNSANGAEHEGLDMKLRGILLAAALAVGAATGAHADGFSDTSMGVRDQPFTSNPGGGKGSRNVNKIVVNVGHFDVWDYGSNFFNVDILFSNANEPANNSAGGSTELYGVYRGQLSPDKIFGLNTKFGPFSAINFEFGGDAETENTAFAPDKKLLVAGPNFSIAVPAGFLDIGVHVSKEWNNNGIAGGLAALGLKGFHTPTNFHATPEFEFVWLFPMSFTGLPMDFRGFMNIVAPKGKDGFGNQTAWEVLARPQINLDIGQMMINKKGKIYAYLGLEIWQNKFGNKSDTTPGGTEEFTPLFGVEYHF
jgi:nucleoside-specific outer membrane channel protein Tsx